MDHREEWGTKIGFVLAALGSAVGLGNIWRFSYMAYKNGGGAFLIPYFIALFIVGIPLMILEFGIGHKLKGSAPKALGLINPRFSWLGWWAVSFVMFGIVIYYAVIISWCLNYVFFSFTTQWGTDASTFFYKTYLNLSAGPLSFGDKIINIKILASLAVIWFLNWIIVYSGIKKGIEIANKIFIPLLFILIFILILWTLQLPGAITGIKSYLLPDFNKLADTSVWVDAFTQIFFTLSLGFGIMIAYASYLPKKSDITLSALQVSIGNCLFSFISGFIVFATLGFMANSVGKSVSDVVASGPGLCFVVYPKAISSLPHFNSLFGIIFFTSLVIAGLSSSISILEAFTAAVIDKFNYKRKNVVTILCILGFFLGIFFTAGNGLYLLDIIDQIATKFGLVLVAILECIIVGWFYTARRLRNHIEEVSNFTLHGWKDYLMRIIITLLLLMTYYSLAISDTAATTALFGRILILSGICLIWWMEHWLDFNIKIAIPALLIILFDNAFIATFIPPYYGGYSFGVNFGIGIGWLFITLIIGLVLDRKSVPTVK